MCSGRSGCRLSTRTGSSPGTNRLMNSISHPLEFKTLEQEPGPLQGLEAQAHALREPERELSRKLPPRGPVPEADGPPVAAGHENGPKGAVPSLVEHRD